MPLKYDLKVFFDYCSNITVTNVFLFVIIRIKFYFELLIEKRNEHNEKEMTLLKLLLINIKIENIGI